ncbi:MAG: AAA family ATPase [Candidatus Binatia bacterium]
MNKLLEDLDPKTKSVFIFNTNVTFEEILEYIFAEFDLPVHNGKKLYMLQRLNAFLLDELRAGVNVALLIDEAQDLEFSVLEDLRLLSNLETAKEKILQIVLSGQPELGQKLSNPILRQLRQRIGINCRLLPLSRDEITEYLQYRLQAAGCPDLKLFSREAEERIYHFSRGIPRLVNVVCDNALVIGYALGKKRIGADLITEAAADLLSDEPLTEEAKGQAHAPSVPSMSPAAPASAQSRWRARLAVISVLIGTIAVGLLSVGRTMLLKPAEENVSVELAPPRLEVIRPGSQPEGTGVEVPMVRSAESGGNTASVSDARAARVPPAPPAKAIVAEEPAVVGDAGTRDDRASEGKSAPNSPSASGSDNVSGRDGEASVRGARADQAPALGGLSEEHPKVALARPVSAPDGAPVALNTAKGEQTGSVAKLSEPLPRETTALNRKKHESAPSEMKEAEPQGGVGSKGWIDIGREPRLEGMSLTHVVVRSGDSVSGIARRKYGQASCTVLDLLKLANPELKDINVIAVGQTIRLPELGDGFPILHDGSGHYALLVLSTPHTFRASAVQSALRSHGLEAHVSGGSMGIQKPVFRVVLSGYTSREELVEVGRQVQKLFRDDARIAQLGE